MSTGTQDAIGTRELRAQVDWSIARARRSIERAEIAASAKADPWMLWVTRIVLFAGGTLVLDAIDGGATLALLMQLIG